jgi:hypothetical protein
MKVTDFESSIQIFKRAFELRNLSNTFFKAFPLIFQKLPIINSTFNLSLQVIVYANSFNAIKSTFHVVFREFSHFHSRQHLSPLDLFTHAPSINIKKHSNRRIEQSTTSDFHNHRRDSYSSPFPPTGIQSNFGNSL